MARTRNELMVEHRLDPLAPVLPVLRRALEDQFEFRIEQLTQLDAADKPQPSPPTCSVRGADAHVTPAVREVQTIMLHAAHRALADIERALARMDIGTYGRCRVCDAAIGTAVLMAIPMTTLCLPCQEQEHVPSRDHDDNRRRRRGQTTTRPFRGPTRGAGRPDR